jgi:tryptophan halogenase
MLGQGIMPEGYDPPVDGLDEQKVAHALEQIRNAINEMADRLPTHGEFVAQCVAAAANPMESRNEFAL